MVSLTVYCDVKIVTYDQGESQSQCKNINMASLTVYCDLKPIRRAILAPWSLE